MISIIVPVYNSKDSLRQCVDSICNQKYADLEIILVDDGSTDGSGEACDELAKMDSRIKVIHRANGGSVAARKTGLSEASGEYVGFVDSDDWIESGMYEYLSQTMDSQNADVVQIRMCGAGDNADSVRTLVFSNENREQMLSAYLFESIEISSNLWSKLFQRDLLKKAFSKVPEGQQFGEDLICMVHYLSACHKVCICGREFYHYRELENSLSRKPWDTMTVETSALFAEVKQALKDYNLWDGCKDEAVHYYKRVLVSFLKESPGGENLINDYDVPKLPIEKNSKVVIYGAGKVGKSYYNRLAVEEGYQVVAWVDQKADHKLISSSDCLKNIDFDVVIIAVANEEVANDIKDYLVENALCEGTKIFWKEPIRLW